MVNQGLSRWLCRFGTVNGYFVNFARAAPRIAAPGS
jgi:hypothetical protein